MDNYALMYHDIQAILQSIYPTFNQKLERAIPDCKVLNKNFQQINHNDKKLRFCPQDETLKFPELGYEQRIYHEGIIATRNNNWHDFFNAMVWHRFANIKCAINAQHIQEIQKQKNNNRSRQRDLLTLFDECGVIIVANNQLLELIRQHKWAELFIKNKDLWLSGDIKIKTFGHAMFEKYLNPYIGMTAQALLLEDINNNEEDFISEGILNRKILLSKAELSPLPVLGIPGWYTNQNDEFYANKNYFRDR